MALLIRDYIANLVILLLLNQFWQCNYKKDKIVALF